MPEGNAWKYRPERQARLQADLKNPEYVRRVEMYRKARGRFAKLRIAKWNVAWNVAGRPSDFPDFPAWSAANPPSDYEQMIKDVDRTVNNG